MTIQGSIAEVQRSYYSGYTPKGYEQITGLSGVKTLNVPAGAGAALIQTTTQSVRYRDDGVAPSASVGMLLASGDSMWYTSNLSALKLIETAASAVVNVSYYG